MEPPPVPGRSPVVPTASANTHTIASIVALTSAIVGYIEWQTQSEPQLNAAPPPKPLRAVRQASLGIIEIFRSIFCSEQVRTRERDAIQEMLAGPHSVGLRAVDVLRDSSYHGTQRPWRRTLVEDWLASGLSVVKRSGRCIRDCVTGCLSGPSGSITACITESQRGTGLRADDDE